MGTGPWVLAFGALAVVAAAKALTQDTDGDEHTDLFGVVVDPSMYRMVPFVWSAGGEVVPERHVRIGGICRIDSGLWR